jgi:ribose-phosphate pyrophosphokinase
LRPSGSCLATVFHGERTLAERPLTIVAGTANPDLSANIAEQLGIHLASCRLQPFPDGELQVELQQSVRGHDVHLVQSTSPPVERHLLELVLLADACRRAGAGPVTGVVPYFGYARQDRRVGRRRSLGARVLADLLGASAIGRLVVVDLHTPAIEGFFPMAVEQCTPSDPCSLKRYATCTRTHH